MADALLGCREGEDWDFMAIDENSPEFSACTCYDRSEPSDMDECAG